MGLILGAFAVGILPARAGGTYTVGLGIHRMTKVAPIYLLVELGPLFVFGAIGTYLGLRRRRVAFFESMSFLLGAALLLTFLVVVPQEADYILRKGIKVVQVPLVVFASVACAAYLDWPARWRLCVASVPVILCGFLTLCTDIVQYVDLDSERATHISPSQMQALDWIRENTATDAVVQRLDEVRPGRGLQNFDVEISIPALAERRTLFGNYKLVYQSHVPNADVNRRTAILERVFVARSPDALRENLEQLSSHYILVDRRLPGPVGEVTRLTDSGYLEVVFRVGDISVVRRTGAGQNDRSVSKQRLSSNAHASGRPVAVIAELLR